MSTPTENLKVARPFVAYMEEHSNLRKICEEGKGKLMTSSSLSSLLTLYSKIGKLQWERDIPQEALDNLQNLANSDFKQNLGKIIHDIYLTGHNLFKDMPQGKLYQIKIVSNESVKKIREMSIGDHKKRAKYRFASKTLMRILPAEKRTEVETLINQKTMTLDLYEILGQCTWGQADSKSV